MTIRFRLASALAAVLIAFTPAAASAQDQPMADEKDGAVTHVSSATADFSEVVPGVSKKALWGDEEEGPYGNFTRFTPGQVNPLHTHTNEIRLVVLEGAYIYTPEGGAEIRVGPGEYLSIPGGVAHVSAGDTEDGALFYASSEGGFDLNPIDQ
jgi:quercetin dioxygenase-like cupin family protein